MSTKLNNSPLVWGDHELQTDEPKEFAIGESEIQTKLHADELWIAASVDGAPVLPDGLIKHGTDERTWGRWAFKKPPTSIRMLPLLPDRSVVATPETPFNLAISTSAYLRSRTRLDPDRNSKAI